MAVKMKPRDYFEGANSLQGSSAKVASLSELLRYCFDSPGRKQAEHEHEGKASCNAWRQQEGGHYHAWKKIGIVMIPNVPAVSDLRRQRLQLKLLLCEQQPAAGQHQQQPSGPCCVPVLVAPAEPHVLICLMRLI